MEIKVSLEDEKAAAFLQPATRSLSGQFKSWFITRNNPDDAFIEKVKAQLTSGAASTVVGGLEAAPSTGTRHLHAVIVFATRQRFTSVQRLFPGANISATRNQACAEEYCRKDGDVFIDHVAESNQGHRSDLDAAREVIQSHRCWADVINDPRITKTVRSHLNWAKECFAYKPKRARIKYTRLRVWQRSLVDELSGEADDRKIIWYVDVEGGAGKTTLARQLEDCQVISGGREQDIFFAVSGEPPRIFVFDLARSKSEWIPYSSMEKIKDGMWTSSKYQSANVVLDYSPWVVVFANVEPDLSKMSMDRWVVRYLNDADRELEPDPDVVPATPDADDTDLDE